MKNKIFLYCVILISSLSSCEKWLEETNPTEVDNNFVYTTVEGLKTNVVSLYNRARTIVSMGSNSDRYLLLPASTDIMVSRTVFGKRQFYDPAVFNAVNLSQSEDYWKLNYRIIERANAIIKAAPNVDMSEKERNQILAEAQCHRAEAYFTLIRIFDNIYLTTEPTSPESALDINIIYNVASAKDVFDLIDSDLDFAIEHLEWTDLPGKYTQAAARHIRAKTAMWQEDWGTAIEHCKAIIGSGYYQLLATDVVFGKNDGNRNNAESLYTYQFDFEKQGIGGGGNAHRVASFFLANYAQHKGLKFEATQGGNTRGWSAPNNYLLSLYDYNNTQDKRYNDYLRRFYIYNDASDLPEGTELGDTLYLDPNSTNYENGRIGLWKWYEPDRDIGTHAGYGDVIVYRLAETHLIAAEAYMRSNNQGEALKHINAVRTRADINELPTVTEQDIMDERARELAAEGQRWFFLKRIGKLLEQIRAYAGDDDNFDDARTNIKAHNVRWPIHDSQIKLMKGFPQNPGY